MKTAGGANPALMSGLPGCNQTCGGSDGDMMDCMRPNLNCFEIGIEDVLTGIGQKMKPAKKKKAYLLASSVGGGVAS